MFRELYLAEPSDDEGNPFGIREIDACVAPLSTAAPRYWGWDLARKQDWTVGIALDRGGYVCKFERFRKPWDLTFELIVDRTRHTSARVDATGVGDVIVEGLVKKCKQLEGYVFTGPSKQILMEGLALAIHKKAVRFPEGPIASELRQFEYEYSPGGRVKYSAPGGQYDDAVCLAAGTDIRTARGVVQIQNVVLWVTWFLRISGGIDGSCRWGNEKRRLPIL